MQHRSISPQNGNVRSSFENISEEAFEAHLEVSRYGSFELTDAIRPSYDLQVVPREGYRHDSYRDSDAGIRVPALMAAVSREKLFEVFMDLLEPLGKEVDVVLETSHDTSSKSHENLYREHIDLPVLKSTLYDFEDLLLEDGCTGIAVLNPNIPREVQFDEHKMLIMYGEDLLDFEDILAQHRIRLDETIRFITEAEHIHSSSDGYQRTFQQLQYRLGLDDE